MAQKLITDMYTLKYIYLSCSIFKDLFLIVVFTTNLVLQLVVILNDKRGYTGTIINQGLLFEFEGSSLYICLSCAEMV